MTTYRRKRGRPPSIWHGQKGEEFQTAVYLTRYERRHHPISKAQAIRLVLRRSDFAHLRKYSVRYLEKQFLDAVEFWNKFARLRKEWLKANKIHKSDLQE
jgi:hypothetical protein